MTGESSSSGRADGAGPLAALERLVVRVWLFIPGWAFMLIGALGTFGYVLARSGDYLDFWHMGARVRFPDGHTMRVPFTRVLVDLTFVLMGASFVLRHRPKARNANARHIITGALGGSLPLLPFLFDGLLTQVAPDFRREVWRPLFMDRQLAPWRTVAAVSCLLVGNALDVWAYTVLFRSFSVVAEARELVVRAPYRFVRHPVYLGQMIAQAALWLFFAVPHGGWLAYYLLFVGIQLYRSRVEERVLEAAFGDAYRALAAKSVWFWRLPPSPSTTAATVRAGDAG